MLKHFVSIQFLLYLAAGTSAAAINWASRIVLNMWMSFPAAVAIAYLISTSSAFLFNRFFVFSPDRPMAKQAAGFLLTNLAFFPVIELCAIYFNRFLIQFGFPEHSREIAHAAAIAVPMLGTFLIYKFVIFKKVDRPEARPDASGSAAQARP